MHSPLNNQNSALRKTAVVTCTSVRTFALLWVLMLAVAEPAFAQNERVVYNFGNPPDAYGPKCNLVLDTAGNLYGTTLAVACTTSERCLGFLQLEQKQCSTASPVERMEVTRWPACFATRQPAICMAQR